MVDGKSEENRVRCKMSERVRKRMKGKKEYKRQSKIEKGGTKQKERVKERKIE